MNRRNALKLLGAFAASMPVQKLLSLSGRSMEPRASIAEIAGLRRGSFLLTPGTEAIHSDVRLPAEIALRIPPGSRIRPAEGVTVVLEGPVEAGPYPIFDITAGGSVQVLGPVAATYPQWWGAAGDGITDDYPALLASFENLNRRGGGTLDLPAGTYRVDRYRITGGPNANDVQPLEIHDCAGVVLRGYGAKLDFKGDFHRSRDTARGMSYSNSVHVAIRSCTKVRIAGLELDGNVDQMTRDTGVIEHASNTGLRIEGGSDIEVRDTHLHHWATDGLYLVTDLSHGRPGSPARDLVFLGVVSEYNARGGAGIVNAWGARFTDCTFARIGRSAGDYGGHAPQFGVDVEPIGTEDGRVDRKTGNLSFSRCHFADCAGALLTAPYWQQYDGMISFSDCDFDASGPGPRHPIALIFQAPSGLMERCVVKGHERTCHLTWRASSQSRVTYRDVEFHVSAEQGLVSRAPAELVLDHCRIVVDASRALSAPPVVLTNPEATVRECQFFVSARAYAGKGEQEVVQMGVGAAIGNRYETDEPSAARPHFITRYGGTGRVDGEEYPSAGWRRSGG